MIDTVFLGEVIKKGYLFEKAALQKIKKEFVSKEQFEMFLLDLDEKIITLESVDLFLRKKEKKEVIVEKTEYCLAKDVDSEVKIKERKETKRDKDLSLIHSLFFSKYEKLRKIIKSRRDTTNAVSIGNITKLHIVNEDIVIIAMVKEKYTTKNNNLILELEDNTGEIKGFIGKDESINIDDIILDDVAGFKGRYNGNYFFIKDVIYPDIPLPDAINTIEDDLNSVFISDLHYGSKNFLEKVEYKFINWLNSNEKDALKVKYVFIAGDIADGVGVYASQKEDLEIADIFDQYSKFEEFVEKIPEYINICVIPGNHDAVRSSEPQPALDKNLLPRISEFKNVFLGENPSYFNIHGQDGNRGINVLMYHGYSFTSIANQVTSLRQKGIKEPQYIMKDVLRRRHLAPFYGATLQAPDEEDYLVIDDIPDIFHTGDLHSHAIDNYKGVTLISSSTWQSQTSFQDRVGHVANPGKISLVNLKTRIPKYMDYMK